MIKYIRSVRRAIHQINHLSLKSVEEPVEFDWKNPKFLLGKLLAGMNRKEEFGNIRDAEFGVFSQWGDDGIIQYLVDRIDIKNKTFIEFGVENYKESNTRFLLMNNNWSGLVMDGSEENMKYVALDPVCWAHELQAWPVFITRENINSMLQRFLDLGFDKEIGILSVDIDGNDFWIWKEINVVNPAIVISEYNSLWGPEKPWTIPYQPDFYRLDPGNSMIHYGASLLSLCDLAEEKGYFFIGCNSAGNNAYFVRKDKIGPFKPLSAKEGFVLAKFRELPPENGVRPFGNDRMEHLKGRQVYNTRTNQIEVIQ
jgi:hypothetical protein